MLSATFIATSRSVARGIAPAAGLGWTGCVLFATLCCPLKSAVAADLEVEVRGVKPRAGEIHAAVFDNAEDFHLDIQVRAAVSREGELSAGVFASESDFPRAPLQRLAAQPTARTIHLLFIDLEPGEYGVALYQDSNGDGKLDTTLARVPVEPWGLSNNPLPADRPPQWDEVKFTVPAHGARIIINLNPPAAR